MRTGSWLRAAPLALVLLVTAICLARSHDPEHGFSRLLRFGAHFAPQRVPALDELQPYVLPDSYGYDGQFYAQMAFDPLLQSPATAAAMDDAAYRFRRVLQPWLAWLLGGGQPWLVLQMAALVPWLAWIALALLLQHAWRPRGPDTFLRWGAVLFASGVVSALTQGLVDLLMLTLLAAALLLVERRRAGAAAGSLALALLARETAALALVLAPRRPLARAVRFVAIAMSPLLVWMLWLAFAGHGASPGGRNFAWPGSGLVREASEALAFAAEGHYANLCVLAGLLVQCVALVLHRDLASPWWRVGAVHVLFALVLGDAVWEGNPGAAYRVLLPLTLGFAASLPRSSRLFWPLLLGGSLPALVGVKQLLDLVR